MNESIVIGMPDEHILTPEARIDLIDAIKISWRVDIASADVVVLRKWLLDVLIAGIDALGDWSDAELLAEWDAMHKGE